MTVKLSNCVTHLPPSPVADILFRTHPHLQDAFPLELKRDLDKLQDMARAPVNYDEPPKFSRSTYK